MAYICELNPGHHVYLDNQDAQTVVTTTMQQAGQQQQATSRIPTGAWISPPTAYHTASGATFKIFAAQGETCIYVQGTSVSTTSSGPTATAQQLAVQETTAVPPSMQPMQPMEPMKPMTMGNMTMNPMEMRMGNMEMKMEPMAQPGNQPSPRQQFCTQCGTKVAPEDKFCGNCGHALGKNS